MRTVTALRAAGLTDPGLKRDVNEDRFHIDLARGLFMVVDGVGGQAAGEKAAETALAMVRTRLERETGAIEDRRGFPPRTRSLVTRPCSEAAARTNTQSPARRATP